MDYRFIRKHVRFRRKLRLGLVTASLSSAGITFLAFKGQFAVDASMTFAAVFTQIIGFFFLQGLMNNKYTEIDEKTLCLVDANSFRSFWGEVLILAFVLTACSKVIDPFSGVIVGFFMILLRPHVSGPEVLSSTSNSFDESINSMSGKNPASWTTPGAPLYELVMKNRD